MNNRLQAKWAAIARKAVAAHDIQAEGHRTMTDKGATPMLLASLMHLSDVEKWDFDEMLTQGRHIYLSEKAEIQE